jgi:hypothetical protein
VEALLNFLRVKAFSRGLRGYHTAWFVVGVAMWMMHRARTREDVVYRTRLKPGERLVIRTLAPGGSDTPGD